MAATTDLTEEQQHSAPAWRDFEHTGPGTLAGRFMRRFWHPVYVARDLPAGRAKPVKIMSEDFTLYRGESGEVHAVAFRCAHRGTQLSTGWVEGENIRCFYHGWAYGPNGQCVEQPAELEPFCNRIRIKSYPVREYIGLIFAYMGEGEPPEFPRVPEFEGDGVLENSTYVRMCNYFNQLESNMDEAHVAFVHRNSDFTAVGLNNDIPFITGEETDYGVVKYGHRKDQPVRVSHFFMPDALWIAGSGGAAGGTVSQNIAWRVPIDDERHQSFNASFVPLTGEEAERYRERQAERRQRMQGLPTSNEITAAILRGELHADDVADRGDVVNIQDNVAQGGQGIIADRIHEHLGATDVMIVTFRRIWERELRALAENRPLKEWKRTGELAATFGT